jgi:transcriptional regulator
MYIPKHFLTSDREEIISFIKQYSFGTIINTKNNYPMATHLPFLVSVKEETVVLSAHFAKANPQWEIIAENPSLVIFSEPHAYISPKHYDREMNVPTWNYFSVHAYGQGTILTGEAQTYKILEATINSYEPAYKKQWDALPDDYKTKMIKGIVAFEIIVTDLQAKKKLSQNRSDFEKEKIIAHLSASENQNEKDIAHYMSQLNEGGK